MVIRCSLYSRDLVMLSPVDRGDPSIQNGFFDPYPTVSLKQFESLKAHSAGQFTGLAFYVPAPLRVETPTGKHTLMVARTTADLFRLLNVPAHSGKLVVPASADKWLIEDETAFAALPDYTEGFVIGRLRYDTLHDSRFRFIRLRDRSLGIFCDCSGGFCVRLRICSPSCRPIPPEDIRGASGREEVSSLPRRRFWLCRSCMFGSLDLASVGSSLSPLYFDLALFGSLFAVRWINADQRKRCPVCLRLLANPVRIGESSRILLEWHGTELMCLRGHGLLYVPEWPAIWSGQQRWLDLGPSWGGLFSLITHRPAIPSAAHRAQSSSEYSAAAARRFHPRSSPHE